MVEAIVESFGGLFGQIEVAADIFVLEADFAFAFALDFLAIFIEQENLVAAERLPDWGFFVAVVNLEVAEAKPDSLIK